MITQITQEVTPILKRKLRSVLVEDGTWNSLHEFQRHDVFSASTIEEVNELLEDGLWPVYSIQDSEGISKEAFVIRKKGINYIVVYVKAGEPNITYSVVSGKHLRDEIRPSKIFGGRT